ncbi:MAG TPA: hypothetical protein VKY19_21275 [Ktedonosporobacter sp.]|jgi:hypothetical protein|nr:hypothetical protein [Ktedonosporobacter sp.]
MRKLEVFIEENALGAVRPVEVVADAPISALVTALVEELKLPQTDLFGKKLVYILRQSAGGHILPEHATLLESGVAAGDKLVLDSYVLDEAVMVGASVKQHFAADSTLHSSPTIADASMFAAMGPVGQSGISSTQLPVARPERKWGRRAFLLLGGAVLGAGGVGIGYAAYQQFLNGAFNGLNHVAVQQQPVTKQTQAPAKPTTFTMARQQVVFMGHQQPVRALAWSPDGTMLASGADDALLLIWGTDGAVRQTFRHPAAVHAVAWAADSQRLTTGAGTQVAFFSVAAGRMLARPVRRHNQMVTSVAWAAQGQMQAVSAGADLRAVVWNTVNYRPQFTYARHTAPIDVVSIAADGQTVATSSQGGFIRIWQAANGQDLHGYYQDAQAPMRAMAFAPTGAQLAVGGDDGIVRIWSALTCQMQTAGRCLDVPQKFQASQMAIRTVAWSPDARYLAVGAEDGKLSIWNTAQLQKPLFTIQHNGIVHGATWSPDGKRLASASGNVAIIWALM